MKLTLLLRVVVILAFLFIMGHGVYVMRILSVSGQRQESASRAIANYALAERSLQLDLLGERAGLLRNYDTINADVASGVHDLAELQKAGLEGNAQRLLRQLVLKDQREEDLIAEFNSENALVQNSLAYIAEHSNDVGGRTLTSQMLKLTLDNTPQAVKRARAELQLMPSGAEGSAAARLRLQATTLVDSLPQVDVLLSSIRALMMEDRVSELQSLIHSDADDVERLSRRLEEFLTGVVLILVLTVITLVIVQRSKTRDLESQAANERLSAAIAVPLIDTGPGTFLSRVQDATDQLADHIGARKLQLLIPALTGSALFTRSASSLPPDWLAKLTTAADVDRAWNDNRVIRLHRNIPKKDALSLAMLDTGVNDLILLRTAEPFRVIIGIEPENNLMAQRRDYLAGISSAIIAVAHGARRDMMEHERERLEQTLNQKRRMEKIGRIASGIAHNFNNIIGAIGGFAEIGQEMTDRGSALRLRFDDIEGAVQRAQELIEAILTYARQRRPRKSRLNLTILLSQSLDMFSASFHGKSSFCLDQSDEHHYVYVSGIDIQQVILNICNNAAQAALGNCIDISVAHRQISEKREMSHACLYPGSYAVITIGDRGPGIPKMAERQLFEPFFTTKAAGTGLGLSTAWEIVQDHAGTIHVESRREGGAEFSIWLPELSADAKGEALGSGSRVLLLSEPDHLSADEDMLAEVGFEPVGISLVDIIESKLDLRETDAVLIATSRSWHADEIARSLLPTLDGRPLLIAVSADDPRQIPMPAQRITYPLRPDEISELLPLLVETFVTERRDGPGMRLST